MKIKLLIVNLILLVMTQMNANGQSGPTVVISTTYGDITVMLYDQTPLHRDNFLKLASEGFFDGTLFHRVIKDFMIQAGDPNSKGAAKGVPLGMGGPGYQIPAEFVPAFCHKKGALSAARQGDQTNPERKSSGSQFYIVQGKVSSENELKAMEAQVNNSNLQSFYPQFVSRPENQHYAQTIDSLRGASDLEGLSAISQELATKMVNDAQFPRFTYTDEQIKTYTTIGGTPFLDNQYTVFGEVIEGLDVLDKIAAVATDDRDRPLEDVVLTVKVVK